MHVRIPFFVFSTPSKDAHRCTYTHTHHTYHPTTTPTPIHTHIHTLTLTPSHQHPHPHTLTCMLSYDCGGETVHTPSLQYRRLPSPPPGRGYRYCGCGTEGLRRSSASKPCRVHLSTGTHTPGSPVYEKIRETLTNLLQHIRVKGIGGPSLSCHCSITELQQLGSQTTTDPALAYHKYAADSLQNLFLVEGKFLSFSLFHSLLLKFLQSIHLTRYLTLAGMHL